MSAFGRKADIIQGVEKSPLIAISGHKDEGRKSEIFPNQGARKTPAQRSSSSARASIRSSSMKTQSSGTAGADAGNRSHQNL